MENGGEGLVRRYYMLVLSRRKERERERERGKIDTKKWNERRWVEKATTTTTMMMTTIGEGGEDC